MGADLVISANTIVEVSHSRVNTARPQWALSRAKVEPVTEQTAEDAATAAPVGVHADPGAGWSATHLTKHYEPRSPGERRIGYSQSAERDR